MAFNVGRILKITSMAALMVAMGVVLAGCPSTVLQSNPSSVSLNVGDTQALVISYYTFSTNSVTIVTDATFTSDTPAIATVDASGVVTGVAVGATNITVTGAGMTIKVPVIVGPVPPPSMFSISGAASGLPDGCTVQITNQATFEVLAIAGSTANISSISFAFAVLMGDTTAWQVVVLAQPTCTNAPTCGISVGSSGATAGTVNGVGSAAGTIDAANVTGLNVRCASEIDATPAALNSTASMVVGSTATVDITSLPGPTGGIAVPFADLTLAGSWTTDNSIAVADNSSAATPTTLLVTAHDNGAATTSIDVTDNVTGMTVSVPVAVRLATVSATVAGVDSATNLALQDNGTDTHTFAADGSWTFATGLNNGGAYAVTVSTYPTGHDCQITGGTNNDGSGTIAAADVSVNVSCGNATLAAAATPTAMDHTTPLVTQTLGVTEAVTSTVTGGWNQAATALANTAVTWASTTTGVCTVDANGVVTAVAAGTCTITANYHSLTPVTFTITVN